MGYQGMLIEMAKEYVVLATSQSQSLMCGGQMSCNKHLMEGWAPVEPQIVWNRSALLGQASAAKPVDRQQQHYVAVSQLTEKTAEPMKLQPLLPQRNPGMQQPQRNPGMQQPQRNPGMQQPQRNPGMQQPQRNSGMQQQQRNSGMQQHESPGPSPDEENHKQASPAVADNANAKEAAAKSKKRFRLFRTMRSVIKSRFRK